MYVCGTDISVLFKLFSGSFEESDVYLVGEKGKKVPYHLLVEPFSTSLHKMSLLVPPLKGTPPNTTFQYVASAAPWSSHPTFPAHSSLSFSYTMTMTMPKTGYMAFFLLFSFLAWGIPDCGFIPISPWPTSLPTQYWSPQARQETLVVYHTAPGSGVLGRKLSLTQTL